MRETHDGPGEVSYLPPAAPPRNHGHTTAAWVTVTLVLVGALVASVAVVLGEAWMLWGGLGVIVVALVLGRVLKMLGFGQPGQKAGSHDADQAAS